MKDEACGKRTGGPIPHGLRRDERVRSVFGRATDCSGSGRLVNPFQQRQVRIADAHDDRGMRHERVLVSSTDMGADSALAIDDSGEIGRFGRGQRPGQRGAHIGVTLTVERTIPSASAGARFRLESLTAPMANAVQERRNRTAGECGVIARPRAIAKEPPSGSREGLMAALADIGLHRFHSFGVTNGNMISIVAQLLGGWEEEEVPA